MNLEYWGFHRWPFDRTCDGANLFVSPLLEEAFARMMFLIEEHRRCGLLTGPSGTGKTCLLREVASKTRRQGRACSLINATGCIGSELAVAIASGLGANADASDSTQQIWHLLQTRFESLALVGQPAVMIIDQLEGADAGCHATLRRMLLTSDRAQANLTLVIGARSTSAIESDDGIDIGESVELHLELTPWTTVEVREFIAQSLDQAGGAQPIFTFNAVESIHTLSRGIPRSVNWLCDVALLAATHDNIRRIDADLVEAVAADLVPFKKSLWSGAEVHSF